MTTPRSESKKSSSKTAATQTGSQDAVALLKADHRRVEELFSEFEEATRSDRKSRLASEICTELKVHTELEEQLFYPRAREALKKSDADLLDEATVEHASAKWLIEQIEGMEPGDELYDAKVKVLSEYIKHHVKEEETELFPKLGKTDLDLDELGEEMQALKAQLQQKFTRH